MYIALVACLVILCFCYYSFRFSRKRLYELAAFIPGPPEFPLIGNALEFYGNTLDIAKTIKRLLLHNCLKCGGVIKIWLGPILYLGVVNPGDVEIILSKELNKDPAYRFLKPWLGNGLVCGELSLWKVHRKKLMPTFNQTILDNFVEVFVEKSEMMTKQMLQKIGTFDALDLVAPCVLDIICETAMGVEVNAQETMESPYIRATISISKIIYKRMTQIWLQPDWIFRLTSHSKQQNGYIKTIHDFTKHIMVLKNQEIQNRNKTNGKVDEYIGDCSTNKRKAFLDLLMEDEGDRQWTDDELREEVDTMTAAGNDVTTHTSCFILLMIGSNQEVQQKAFDELYNIFGDSKRSVTKEDLSKMEYLGRVIKETLRLFPIVPMIVRHLAEEVKLEHYTLPAGAGCVIPIYGIQRDPKIWGEKADEFDPDNFLPEKCAKRHPCSFLAFSAGPRNCIGKQYGMMAMKVILTNILRSFKIHSDVNCKNLEWMSEILMKPVGGYPISIQPRSL